MSSKGVVGEGLGEGTHTTFSFSSVGGNMCGVGSRSCTCPLWRARCGFNCRCQSRRRPVRMVRGGWRTTRGAFARVVSSLLTWLHLDRAHRTRSLSDIATLVASCILHPLSFILISFRLQAVISL